MKRNEIIDFLNAKYGDGKRWSKGMDWRDKNGHIIEMYDEHRGLRIVRYGMAKVYLFWNLSVDGNNLITKDNKAVC